MGEAKRRKAMPCRPALEGKCEMPSWHFWEHKFSNWCHCEVCEVQHQSLKDAREAREASARIFRDHPFKMDEPNILDMREGSPTYAEVIDADGLKPEPVQISNGSRKPKMLALSLSVMVLALSASSDFPEDEYQRIRRRR
jgi:hypothetical protein